MLMGKKRYNGEGNIRQRKNGQWEAAVMDGKRPDGRAQMKYFTGKTEKEVRAKLNKWRADRVDGLNVTKKYTFTEWSNAWLEHHSYEISPVTYVSYTHILRLLQEYFGSCDIKDVKSSNVELFLRDISDRGYSDKTRGQCRGMLHQIFRQAAADDLIRKNPVEYVPKMRSVNPSKEKDCYTAEETRLLLNGLPNDKMGWSIRLLIGTGMRMQEILALEPRHIAEDGSTIYVEQAVNVVRGRVHIGKPKTAYSERMVAVPENLWRYAIALRETTNKFVWQSPTRKDVPCNPTYFRDKFKEAVSCVEGVRVLTPHCCRHTNVSLMHEIGADMTAVQSNVGHADFKMTNHYLHVQNSRKQAVAHAFSKAFTIDAPYPPELREVELF